MSLKFPLKCIKFLIFGSSKFEVISLFNKWDPQKYSLNSMNFLQERGSTNMLVALFVY